jgi:hypothetical protein
MRILIWIISILKILLNNIETSHVIINKAKTNWNILIKNKIMDLIQIKDWNFINMRTQSKTAKILIIKVVIITDV